ncbi:MAG: DNA-processing protein DprA [Clostridia bacterium]|nr:DNA-processing protein DprA [Clostridia bacterium]
MNPLVYWVWLSLRCGAGSELGTYLLNHFETPQDVYEANEETLRRVEGIDGNILAALLDRDLTYSEQIVEYCERVNVGIMTMHSSIYPERLRSIHAKPIVLYYRGKIPDIDDNVLIACVGMRKCSDIGAQTAYQLGKDLTHAGAIVVSGMALGIDAAAMNGAIDAGGHTIAVLGCGIDRAYPPENKDLMEKIAKTGTVITEFAPGTAPLGKHFPIRNRILSGLCQGTVVVEADSGSGSLITARNAVRQGRDIFAFPGNAGDPRSEGTNAMLKNGATLVTCAYDILVEYELLYPHRIFTEHISMAKFRKKVASPTEEILSEKTGGILRFERPNTPKPKKAKPISSEPDFPLPVKKSRPERDTSGLEDYEKTVLSVISDVMSVEEISAALSRKTDVPTDTGKLLGALTMLEIGGFLEALPGGSFRPL